MTRTIETNHFEICTTIDWSHKLLNHCKHVLNGIISLKCINDFPLIMSTLLTTKVNGKITSIIHYAFLLFNRLLRH